MSLSKESADALRQCLRILAPHYEPGVRRTMAGQVESHITEGKWVPAWHLKDIARLFYPNDQQRVAAMESQILAAMESKELQSTPKNQSFLASDLAAWIDCPPVPKDSPLRYWLPEWMLETEPPAAKGEAGTGTSPSGDDVEEQALAADADDHDEPLAALFDPVPVDVLEKMFPADGKWQSWTQRAARKGLIHARVGTAMYNPYKAGMWFVTNGGKGLTIGHCRRMLANNHLPDRSMDKKYLLTGELD